MKKLILLLKNIPRKVRIGVDIGLILLILFLFYLSIGAPAFSTEQAFRRAEKINMAGPGEIVDTLGWSDYPMFETLIVAETENGVEFYGEYRMGNSDAWPKGLNIQYRTPLFTYREKTGDLTVAAAPVAVFGLSLYDFETKLPVYVFDEYADAVRAEMELTVRGIYDTRINGQDIYREFSQTFSAEAQRQGEGYFRFLLSGSGWILDYISHVSNGDGYHHVLTDSERGASIPVTVRLYDENDVLIMEKELFIQSPAVKAHSEQNDPLT